VKARMIIAGGLLACALAPAAHAQQTVLSEDFESGLGGWTVSPPQALWHVAPDGECGAVTAMAASNHGPGSCDYQSGTGEASYNDLWSPTFWLEGSPPWTISFDYLKDTDATGELSAVSLYLWNGNRIEDPLNLPLPDAATLQHVVHVDGYNEVWWGESVRLVFTFNADESGNLGSGWLIDNVVVTSAGGWVDLGQAKAGSAGTPSLAGMGSLQPHSANQLDLTNASPGAAAVVFFGLTKLQVNTPFKGGVLVPEPLITIAMPTSPAGTSRLPFVFPPGVPAGTELFFQAWIPDAGASFDLAASNALLGITP
jgi:hypothetical protein